MKKKLLIVAAVCASLFVVMPTASVNAAEVEGDVQEQSVQNDIGVAPVSYTHLDVYKRQFSK